VKVFRFFSLAQQCAGDGERVLALKQRRLFIRFSIIVSASKRLIVD
jgi:hypothetical protein